MASRQEQIRNKLDTKVFAVIGKTVTWRSKDAPTYTDRGEEEDTTYTDSDIVVVPYNIVNSQTSFETIGDQDQGTMEVVVRYDVLIKLEDKLVIETVSWTVKDIEVNYLPDNVATIVRISKDQP